MKKSYILLFFCVLMMSGCIPYRPYQEIYYEEVIYFEEVQPVYIPDPYQTAYQRAKEAEEQRLWQKEHWSLIQRAQEKGKSDANRTFQFDPYPYLHR